MTHLVTNSTNPDGKAITTKKGFSRETAVAINIHTKPAIVWALLTNASDFARWNSTVISIEGEIKQGESIKLKSTLDEKRIFTLQIKEFISEQRLVWGDRQGNRVYTITPGAGDNVTFSMHEKIGGLFFPLYGRFIPSFDESFAQFAADLKKEAEAIHRGR